MYNVKVFSSFKLPPEASDEDRKFLGKLLKLKIENSALYVNFTGLNYRHENPDTVHFLTYPIEWIVQYVKNHYGNIDPLLHMDYRRISFIDWVDLQDDHQTRAMFETFRECGLGNHGLTVVTHMGNNFYGALSMTFEIPNDLWFEFKTKHLKLFRYQTDRICGDYSRIYLGKPRHNYKITPRESECLYWVAKGKTDEQVAETLKIGKWTVVSHLTSAKYKLGTPNRAAAVAIALSTGVIDLNDNVKPNT